MSASDPVPGSGPPLVVALQVGAACAPGERPTKGDTKALIQLLLERKADANRADANGFTPLMAAAMKGCDRAVMKQLIGAGAKVGATNKTGLSAFEMGLFYGHDGLEELIAGGYRLSAEKAKLYAATYAQKPAVLALIKKAAK
jgi:ankyrin repeat protein